MRNFCIVGLEISFINFIQPFFYIFANAIHFEGIFRRILKMQNNDLIETSPKIPLNSIQYNNNEQIQANCDPSFIQTYEKLQTKSRNNLTFV